LGSSPGTADREKESGGEKERGEQFTQQKQLRPEDNGTRSSVLKKVTTTQNSTFAENVFKNGSQTTSGKTETILHQQTHTRKYQCFRQKGNSPK
jgi:hypothetical protein